MIRSEQPCDVDRIRDVHLHAFDDRTEADLVDALRAHAVPLISLVAEDGGGVVGHILFSPVTLAADPHAKLMGLAPMAVRPPKQRQGVGAALVREGLVQCRALGCDAVVVLGHPRYYPRSGFLTASRWGLRCEYDVPDEVFMALELRARSLAGKAGVIRYHPAFATS